MAEPGHQTRRLALSPRAFPLIQNDSLARQPPGQQPQARQPRVYQVSGLIISDQRRVTISYFGIFFAPFRL